MSFIDAAKSAIKAFFTEPQPGDPPAWSTRLKKAQYKSPSGAVLSFEYADIESSVEKKTAIFETATGSGTYVQDNGNTSGRFPMVCFISGNDYDLKAQAFTAMLLETGEGVLTHPIFGDLTVVPTGEIVRGDALVTEAGQAVFGVQFFETTGFLLGEGGGIPSLFDSFSAAAAADFADKLDLSDTADKTNFISKAKAAAKKTADVMKKIARGQAKVQATVEAIGDSINRGIDLTIGQPLTLARQTQILIGEPARIAINTRAKLAGYRDLAGQIFGQTFGGSAHEKTANVNSFHLGNLYAGSFVSSSALVNSGDGVEYTTRAQYMDAAARLLDLFESYQNWKDYSYTAIQGDTVNDKTADTGDGTGQLADLVAETVGSLITASFSALTEIREPLPSERTPLDLCFELYGTADQLNFFCESNDLSGDEIFLIPAGREIVRYV